MGINDGSGNTEGCVHRTKRTSIISFYFISDIAGINKYEIRNRLLCNTIFDDTVVD